jgi:hypothetical protein
MEPPLEFWLRAAAKRKRATTVDIYGCDKPAAFAIDFKRAANHAADFCRMVAAAAQRKPSTSGAREKRTTTAAGRQAKENWLSAWRMLDIHRVSAKRTREVIDAGE